MINKLPNAVSVPRPADSPKIAKRTPTPIKIPVYKNSFFFGKSLSSAVINREVSIALITKATKSEDPKTTDKVIGKYIINLPIIPGQKPSGAKAATVVAVEAIIGHAISPTPCLAASLGDIPSANKRCTFSTTTIPLSTSIPKPITKPKSTIEFSVIPNIDNKSNEQSIDNGIATPTNRAFFAPKKNIKTPTTSKIPKMILFTISSTWALVRTDESLVTVSEISFGKRCCLASSTIL